MLRPSLFGMDSGTISEFDPQNCRRQNELASHPVATRFIADTSRISFRFSFSKHAIIRIGFRRYTSHSWIFFDPRKSLGTDTCGRGGRVDCSVFPAVRGHGGLPQFTSDRLAS